MNLAQIIEKQEVEIKVLDTIIKVINEKDNFEICLLKAYTLGVIEGKKKEREKRL